MSYQGFLIKILGTGTIQDYTIPLTIMQEKTYHGVISTLDRDAYRDANGVLHRTAILQVPRATFQTRALTSTQIGALWKNIQDRYTNALEKRVRATVYVSELDAYMTQEFYVPDIDPTIDKIEHNIIKYEPVAMEFIGYGQA